MGPPSTNWNFGTWTNYSPRAEAGGQWFSDEAWAAEKQRRRDMQQRMRAIEDFAFAATERQSRMKDLLSAGGMSWNDAWEFVMLSEQGEATA